MLFAFIAALHMIVRELTSQVNRTIETRNVTTTRITSFACFLIFTLISQACGIDGQLVRLVEAAEAAFDTGFPSDFGRAMYALLGAAVHVTCNGMKAYLMLEHQRQGNRV